jgi:hypothetical protein
MDFSFSLYAINLGGDSSRVIDLLKALNLDLNSSLFGGVGGVAQGAQQRTTYKLNGTFNCIILLTNFIQYMKSVIQF